MLAVNLQKPFREGCSPEVMSVFPSMPSTAQAQRNLLFFSCGKVSHMSYQCKTVQLRSSKVIKQPTERSGESYLTNIRDKAKIIHAKINVTKITTILSITGTVARSQRSCRHPENSHTF